MWRPPSPMTTPELDLPVRLDRAARDPMSSSGPLMALVHLARPPARSAPEGPLGRVVGVVEADADELADAVDAGAEAQVRLRRAGDNGQALHIKGGAGARGWRGEGGASEVRDDVSDRSRTRPAASSRPGAFLALGAEAEGVSVGVLR